MGTLQVGGTTLGVKNTSTNKVDLSNVGDVTLTSSANIKGAINASGDAPIYACRAWVNFKGTGTVEIRDSGNVSSITDNGTGDYTVNFTTAMADANYAVTNMVAQDDAASAGGSSVDWMIFYSQTASQLRVTSANNSTSADQYYVALAVFR